MQKKYIVLINSVVILFLSGCFLKKKELKQDLIEHDNNFLTILANVELISQEEAKLLGFIFLPFSIQEFRGKKSDNFYVVDGFYGGEITNFIASYQLLKTLYVQDGWALVEEIETNMYMNAFFKKQDREITLFIQEKETYNTGQKKYEKNILLHQSLLLV
jgi:hypothetical protein